MRIESSVTAISWIPREAIQGLPKIPFDLGIGHYDEPPPDQLDEGGLERLRQADRLREANHLKAWIEVEDGKVVGHGHEGGAVVGSTTFRMGPKDVVFAGVPFEILRPEPEVFDDRVRFVQTVGGRAGFPAPRLVKESPSSASTPRPPGPRWRSRSVRTGRQITSSSARARFPVTGSTTATGTSRTRRGTIDFKKWYREAHGEHTPWGAEDSDAFVTQAESALERQISADLMQRGATVGRRKLAQDETLVEEGAPADELLVLDGVLAAVGGEEIAQVGPGAILGEGAVVGGGKRNATLRACTPARVAVIAADQIDREALETLAAGRRADA